MTVVLFCGGLGLRIRGAGGNVPKPLVRIGDRPILLHVMRYYAHFGHNDFVLCLGYGGKAIRNYFRHTQMHDWTITFIETGALANIGQRLTAVERYVRDEPMFLANYCDGLTDLPLPAQFDHFRQRDAIASLISVTPRSSYHLITTDPIGRVTGIRDVGHSGIRINGGYFIFKPEIFDHLHDGEDLVREPFERLLGKRRLVAYRHDGFWMAMDTHKDHQELEAIYARGDAPWDMRRRDRMPYRSVNRSVGV